MQQNRICNWGCFRAYEWKETTRDMFNTDGYKFRH